MQAKPNQTWESYCIVCCCCSSKMVVLINLTVILVKERMCGLCSTSINNMIMKQLFELRTQINPHCICKGFAEINVFQHTV